MADSGETLNPGCRRREITATVLSQITRRKHVHEYRIRHLRALIDSLDAPPASCLRLLTIFHSYCPELVPNFVPTKTGDKELRGKKMEYVETVRSLLRDPNEQDVEGREVSVLPEKDTVNPQC